MLETWPQAVTVYFSKADRELLATPPQRCSRRRRRQQLYRQPDQVRQVAGVELLLELRRHVDHRLVADAELVGDLPIGLALGQQRQGLQLPRGQIGEPVTAQ